MLVTILMLVALSLLTLQYLRRELTLREISRTKAEYAAQSGVASLLEEISSCDELLRVLGAPQKNFSYDDGSVARVKLIPWGLSAIALSEGICGRSHALRRALFSARPPRAFRCALVLGSRTHQLVLTGRTWITGDVALSSGGVTVGTLKDYPTPLRLPVDGKVLQESSASFPEPERGYLQAVREHLEGVLMASPSASSGFQRFNPRNDTSLCRNLAASPDTLALCMLSGSLLLAGQIERRNWPLFIAVDGDVTITPSSRLAGPVAILATGGITFDMKEEADGMMLYSRRSIWIRSGVRASGQFIAPGIRVDSGAALHYPTLLTVLPHHASAGDSCHLHISSYSSVEGFAGVLSDSVEAESESCLIMDPSATLSGAAYSNTFMTMDGNVTGSVLANDFTFVRPPTLYRGWIRGGVINRRARPEGFLVPPVFQGALTMDVLTWL
jgi:hypothetical protein